MDLGGWEEGRVLVEGYEEQRKIKVGRKRAKARGRMERKAGQDRTGRKKERSGRCLLGPYFEAFLG
jgi:hypothetical protein